MLQVFVDDSGRGENQDNPVFLLAGYVGRFQNWEAATDALQRIMRKSPKLEYLKGKEAASLTGNFTGWTAPGPTSPFHRVRSPWRREFNRGTDESSPFHKSAGCTIATNASRRIRVAVGRDFLS